MAEIERDPGQPARLVCRCLGVSSLRVAKALRALPNRDLASAARETRAGTACESCHPELLEILADLDGRAVPAQERAENQIRSQRETERRIESALHGRILPRLPTGTSAELVRVDGLGVWIAFEGPEAEGRELAESLRKLVCPDLEVRFR